MLAVFFDITGPVIQVAVPKCRTVTGLFHKRKVIGNCVNILLNALKGVQLLHDNAPAHASKVVTDILEKEKVKVLPHPTLLTLHQQTFSCFLD